jgi:hypothetical protein
MEKSSFRAGPAEWLCLMVSALLAVVVARLAYMDNFAPSVEYSNRVFARPALGYSMVLTTYAMLRFKSVPVVFRVLAWPFVVFAGYLWIGLYLLFLNGIVGVFAQWLQRSK